MGEMRTSRSGLIMNLWFSEKSGQQDWKQNSSTELPRPLYDIILIYVYILYMILQVIFPCCSSIAGKTWAFTHLVIRSHTVAITSYIPKFPGLKERLSSCITRASLGDSFAQVQERFFETWLLFQGVEMQD